LNQAGIREHRAEKSSTDSEMTRLSAACFFFILCIPMTWKPALYGRLTTQLLLHTSGHPRGSTIKDLRPIVEGAIYDLAPDLMSLTILAPEEKSYSGFVPLQSLLNMVVQSAGVDSAD
jgi:hypothetical protein